MLVKAKMPRKIVILIVILQILVGNLAQVEAVTCYQCSNCEELTDNNKEVPVVCANGICAIWKNFNDQIDRGCKPDGDEAIKYECKDDWCNDDVCQTCSPSLDDCHIAHCKKEDNGLCYISKSDESRGCVSELPIGSNEDYIACNEPNCNSVAICIKCDSGCQQGDLDQYGIEICKNHGKFYEKGCFRDEGDGSLRLGCTSELADPGIVETDVFKKCSGENCNRKAIINECKKCDDADDCKSGNNQEVPEQCQKYPTSCYTAYIRDEGTVHRGCSDSLGNINEAGFTFYDECDEASLCNDKDYPLQCYQCANDCDETKHGYCTETASKFCYTLQQDNEWVHGCDGDDRADDCLENNCRTCENDICNTPNPEPTECFECDGVDQCKKAETKDCNFYEDCNIEYMPGTGQLTKGCGTASSCNPDNCKSCSESGCNQQHCVRCSSEKNYDCITGKGNVEYELCPEEKCVAFVDEQGFVVRGCKSRYPDRKCGADCEFEGPGSNDVPFLKCLHCSDSNCDSESTTEKYCDNFLGCYTKFDEEEEVVERGCVTTEMQCDKDSNCYICTEGNNCNDKDQVYECISCADEDCIENANSCKSIVGCVVFVSDNGNIVRDCVENVSECSDGACNVQSENGQDVCGVMGDPSWKVCATNRNTDKCWRYQKQNEVRMGCWEDKEAVCEGDDDYCKACNTNLCNKEAVAQDWNCHFCSTANGEDCLEDPNKYCTTTRGCVTLFEGSNVIRGCAQELCSGNSLPECENPCVTEYCNNQEVCYACDDCNTIEPSQIAICSTKQCYTSQNLNDKKISRGCLDQSSDEECQENINCIVCEGSLCNADEPKALQCSKCDLGSCGEYAPPESCEENGLLIDQCVDYTVLGVTIYKGCLSSTPNEVKKLCEEQRDFCKFCNENYCNTEELSCYRCSTRDPLLDCLLNPSVSFECNPGDSCKTCLDIDGHLHRGCSNDLSETCSAESEECVSHDCNKNPFPTNRHECYQCENCLETVQSELKPCLLYKNDESCYVQVVDQDTVHRGCTSDAPEPCDNCLQCFDEYGCNSMGPLQNNELTCVICTSNADCEGRAFGKPCQTQLLIGRSDSCYTQFVGEFVIAKGCLSDLPPDNPFYDDCNNPNSPSCTICSMPDCNKGKASCYKCNSAIDPDCSEIVIATNYRYDRCEAECVSKLDNEGYTVRGCIEDFEDFDKESCESSDMCEVCTDKNCNVAMLPADDVLRCYQCEGSDRGCLEGTMGAMMKACKRYAPGDKCYVRAENATWITRGCLSDLMEEESCEEPCLDCDGSGCNQQQVLQPNSLVCVSCEGTNCKGQKDGKRCTEKILLGRQDACYHYDDGQTVQKGCLSDLMQDEESDVKESCEKRDDGNCQLCNYDECNGEYHYCVSCDSSDDPGCAGMMRLVPNALVKDCEQSRCVSRFEDNTVIKGCASTTEPCEKNDPNCSECEGHLCNNIPFPADRILCHQCDECNDVTEVEATICPKYEPEESCFTQVIGNTIQRGCLSEATQKCDEQCFTCSSNGCNNEPDRYDSEISCIHCRGSTGCSEATEEKSARCQESVALGDTAKCFTIKVNKEVLERGCAANQVTKCDTSIDCEELTCSCDNCNLAGQELTCYKCEGKDCGQAMPTTTETCQGTACVSYVSRDGIVSRGCLQDYQTKCSIYGNRHSLCFGDRCNGNVYPVGRMTCYQCEGCTSTEKEHSHICEKYVQFDGCYTLTDGTYVKRGCLSDLPFGCSGANCKSCSDPDCNNKETTTEAPPPVTTPETGTTPESGTTPQPGSTPGSGTTTLEPTTQSCIICSETASDQRCAWAYKPSAATTCKTVSDKDAEQVCFRCLKNALAVRGCTADLDEENCDTGFAIECGESGCNTASFRLQQCAICTRDCDGSKASYTVKTCAGDVEYEQRGCYVLRNARRVVTERGCFADLSEEQRADCLRDGDACSRCTGDVCNAGTRMEAVLAMVIGAIALLVARVKFVL